MAPNTPLAGVGPFPVLAEAYQVGGLEGLQFAESSHGGKGCVDVDDGGRVNVPAEVVVGEDHFLDAVEPGPGVLVVDGIGRDTSA